MKLRITLITLGVDDRDKSLSFYRDGLGWPSQGIIGTEFEHGAVAFCDLAAGLKLALWSRANISYDADLHLGPQSPRVHHWSQRKFKGGGRPSHGICPVC